MSLYKDVTIAFVNNPGISKASGKPYFSLVWGDKEHRQQCWAKEGVLDGINSGDIGTVTTTTTPKGGENFVSWQSKTAGNGAPLKAYRQDERPDAVHSKQVFGYSLAIFGRGDFRKDGVSVAQELAMCRAEAAQALALSDVWDKKTPLVSGMKSLEDAAKAVLDDDTIPY